MAHKEQDIYPIALRFDGYWFPANGTRGLAFNGEVNRATAALAQPRDLDILDLCLELLASGKLSRQEEVEERPLAGHKCTR